MSMGERCDRRGGRGSRRDRTRATVKLRLSRLQPDVDRPARVEHATPNAVATAAPRQRPQHNPGTELPARVRAAPCDTAAGTFATTGAPARRSARPKEQPPRAGARDGCWKWVGPPPRGPHTDAHEHPLPKKERSSRHVGRPTCPAGRPCRVGGGPTRRRTIREPPLVRASLRPGCGRVTREMRITVAERTLRTGPTSTAA
jgi:hypothetical protein